MITDDSTGMDPINIVEVIPAGCNFETGGATLLPAIYTYIWGDNFVGYFREDLAAGIYQVTATDGVCTEVVEVFIEQIEALLVHPEIINEPSCGANNGVVEIFVTGGTGDFSFEGEWGPNALRTDLSPGTYEITVVDNQTGCFTCLLYTSPSPRDATLSRMPSSA